eukprot:25599-Chlamydomonas_euryale.AAC.1
MLWVAGTRCLLGPAHPCAPAPQPPQLHARRTRTCLSAFIPSVSCAIGGGQRGSPPPPPPLPCSSSGGTHCHLLVTTSRDIGARLPPLLTLPPRRDRIEGASTDDANAVASTLTAAACAGGTRCVSSRPSTPLPLPPRLMPPPSPPLPLAATVVACDSRSTPLPSTVTRTCAEGGAQPSAGRRAPPCRTERLEKEPPEVKRIPAPPSTEALPTASAPLPPLPPPPLRPPLAA